MLIGLWKFRVNITHIRGQSSEDLFIFGVYAPLGLNKEINNYFGDLITPEYQYILA